MKALNRFLQKLLPHSLKRRRYLLDGDHYNLTAIEGDVSEWLATFPVTAANAEIYTALAELFRRRGEFDKAVAVHQAISAAKPEGYDASALTLEIAQDYYAAGLLGQAEDVLVQTLEHADESVAHNAFRLWLNILEREQDWFRAMTLVEEYGIKGSGGLRLANLYCEYVTSVWRDTAKPELLKILKRASKLEISTRVELLSAELLQSKGQFKEAIQVYREVLTHDPKRVYLALAPLQQLTSLTQSTDRLIDFLLQLYQLHPSVRILETLLALYQQTEQSLPVAITQAVNEQVKEGGSVEVVKYWAEQQPEDTLKSIEQLLPAIERSSVANTDEHLCIECGYQSEQMLWHCPQCNRWETLYSQYELRIEQKIKKLT